MKGKIISIALLAHYDTIKLQFTLHQERSTY